MEFTKELVLKVNEVYHDFEGELYHDKHDDINEGELDRWRAIGEEFCSNSSEHCVFLDIGTGTGFVPLTMSPYLAKNDLFICSDISQNILDAAEKNLCIQQHMCQYRFLKMNGEIFEGVENSSVDFVTLNSVMHHLPDFQSFFLEMNRILKIGGRIIIGHEPNQSFFRNRFLWNNYVFVSYFFNPFKIIYDSVCFLGLLPIAKKIFKKVSVNDVSDFRKMVNKINEKLIISDAIERPLTEPEVSQLIDIHSPTAGGDLDQDRGIDIPELLKKYGNNFTLDRYETYNHVYRISHKNFILQAYSKFLSRFYPQEGAAFFAILKKRGKTYDVLIE